MTILELREMLLNIPEEHLDQKVYLYQDGGCITELSCIIDDTVVNEGIELW